MKTPNLAIALLLLTVLLALTLLLGVGHRAHAQQIPAGFAPCSAHSLAVSNTSSNVQLANCGPSLILMNLTTQEAFFNVGQASATTATASNYSIPGNSYLQITVPDETGAGWFVASITSTGTTTIRLIEGRAT
jgi:hypothetical protein